MTKKLVKDFSEIQQDIAKEIEVKKLVPQAVLKTVKTIENGLLYVVDFEYRITRDFFFTWLPSKIKKYLKLIVPFLVMAFIIFMPINIPFDMKKALGLFSCIALLWSLEPFGSVVTALLIPVLAVLLGLVKTSNPFESFSNPIIYLLLSGLILAQAFRKHNLDKFIAIKVLAFSKGRIRRLLLYTMLITASLGMWMSNTATISLIIPVILSVSIEIKKRTHKNYTGMLLLSTGFAGSIGAISTILGSNPNAITAAFLRDIAEFTFFDWTRIGFPITIVLFIVAYYVFLKIYDVKHERIKIDHIIEQAREYKMTSEQKKLLMIFLPTLVLWVFGGKISTFFRIPSAFYETEIIGLSCAIVLFGLRLLAWEDVRKIRWEVLLLVGGGLTLGQILINTNTALFIAQNLFHTLSFLPEFGIILIVVVMGIIFANFVNNSSATVILVPVLLQLSPMIGIDNKVLTMTAAMATAVSPLTPIAIPSFALIFGTGKVTRKEMIKTGLTIATICGPLLAAMMYLMYRFI